MAQFSLYVHNPIHSNAQFNLNSSDPQRQAAYYISHNSPPPQLFKLHHKPSYIGLVTCVEISMICKLQTVFSI